MVHRWHQVELSSTVYELGLNPKVRVAALKNETRHVASISKKEEEEFY